MSKPDNNDYKIPESAVLIGFSNGLPGGVFEALSRFLSQQGVEVETLSFRFPGNYIETNMPRGLYQEKSQWTAVTSLLHVIHCIALYRRPSYKRVVAFCGDPISAQVGIAFKLTRRVDYVVYYAIDFSKVRFALSLLQFMYFSLRQISLKFSDEVWCSGTPIKNELQKLGPNCLFEVVPNGVPPEFIRHLADLKSVDYTLWFVGNLTSLTSLDIVIESVPNLVRTFPFIHLHVIGDGPERASLERLSRDLDVSALITWHGKVEHNLIPDLVKEGIGIALYKADPNAYAQFGDSIKVKEYLALGLPVIVSRNTPAAALVDELSVGISCEVTVADFTSSVKRIFVDQSVYLRYRSNALSKRDKLRWSNSFLPAYQRLVQRIKDGS
jgi:glycosyltransferase involved in cell wall biosynthesis